MPPLVINGVEIKSAEPVVGASEIETLLMDNDAKFRNSGPKEKVSSQTMMKEADDGIQMLKTSPIVKAVTPDRDALMALAAKRGIEWDDDIPNRVETYFASDERVDRHGDIVKQSWDFGNFSKNPLLLWSHNWEQPPIGTQLDWSVETRMDKEYEGPALRLLSLFASDDTSVFAGDIMRLVKSGILKTGSVGFYPLELLDVKDDKEREELGLGRWGVVVGKSELVEFSPTSVPANTGAHRVLSMAKSQGILQEADHLLLRRARQAELVMLGLQDMVKREDERWREMWKTLYPEADVKPLEDQQEEASLREQLAELQSQVNVLSKGLEDVQETQDGILAGLLTSKGNDNDLGQEDPFAAALVKSLAGSEDED